MSKKANFDGKEGSYGYYGGQRVPFKSRTLKGYWTKVCSMCPKKALYHCSGKGFCKDHKEEAVKLRIKYRDTRELIANDIEAEIQEFDDRDIKLLKAKKYPSTGLARTRTTLAKDSAKDLQRKLKA